jgi:hypothetical protein
MIDAGIEPVKVEQQRAFSLPEIDIMQHAVVPLPSVFSPRPL